MIAVIDYGLGNIRAITNVYEKLKRSVIVAKKASELASASKLILPGVGAFDHAMKKLKESGMREVLDFLVLEKRIPLLGICIGMQILGKSSDEGVLPGLGYIDATVRKIDINKIDMITKLPHMGWNDLVLVKKNNLTEGIENGSRFYFLHSYYMCCNNRSDTVAETAYGLTFTSIVNCKNIYGVQFHPEKSHLNGAKILSNFAEV